MFNLILFAVQQLTMDGKHTILKKEYKIVSWTKTKNYAVFK